MFKYKCLVFLLVLIGLTACKSTPTEDESSGDLAITAVANSEKAIDSTSESETPVVSTADTNSDYEISQSEYSVKPGEFNLYPRDTSGWDQSGWSIITPSADSRLIYVSSSLGDDETADFYALRDINDIEDPGLIKPFKTIAAALGASRDGFPDWIILRRGDVWVVNIILELKMGRSVEERFVITSYGPSSERPMIKSESPEVLRIWPDQNYMAIIGLSLYAYTRDPLSPDFSGWGNVDNSLAVRIYAPHDVVMGSILFEDNLFNFFSKAITLHGGGKFHDIIIRRNVILNSFSENGHSQGIYAAHASIFMEENTLDHNGWYKQQVGEGNEDAEGQATMFNHNTYFSDANYTISRNNIFLRASSIHQKWTSNSPGGSVTDQVMSSHLLMDGNLFVGGEIGVSAGGNTDYNTGPRWHDVNIIDNVMLAIGRDQPTNRTLGWYIDASDWDSGNICGNHLLHNDNPSVTNLLGIFITGHSVNVDASFNVIYGLMKSESSSNAGAITVNKGPKEEIKITDNFIQLVDSKMRPMVSDSIDQTTFQNNKYFSEADLDVWFRTNGKDYSFDNWNSLVVDAGSSSEELSFLDSERTFETYLLSIGINPTIADFVAEASKQSKLNWRRALTAQQINEYIREGYGNVSCPNKGSTYFSSIN